MGAGDRPHKIVLQTPTGTQDAVGERNTTWVDQATVWAKIRGLSTREVMAAGQRESSASNMIEFPYGANVAAITTAWRVKYGARIYTIEGVVNVDEANHTIQLACTESARTE